MRYCTNKQIRNWCQDRGIYPAQRANPLSVKRAERLNLFTYLNSGRRQNDSFYFANRFIAILSYISLLMFL